MWTGRPGPVQIELPAPVLYATGDESSVRVQPPAALPRPAAGGVRRADRGGGGSARRRGATAGDRRLRRRPGRRERGAARASSTARLPGRHRRWPAAPWCRSTIPTPSTASAPAATRQARGRRRAGRGSRLGNLDLPYDKYWGDPATQRVMQIDIDPRNLGVTRPLALGIVADAKHALAGLARRSGAAAGAGTRASSRAAGARPTSGGRSRCGWSRAGRDPACIRPTWCRRSAGPSGATPIYVTDGGFTSLWATGSSRRRARARISASSSSACSARACRRRSARSSEPRPRGRVRHRRRRGRLPLHGDAVRRARGRQDHRRRLRRGLVVDGDPERADALRARTSAPRWDGALGRGGAGLGCEGLYAETLAEVESALATARDAAGRW